MPHQPPHMSPEEFRRHGHAAIDWIADYWASLDDLPVRSQAAPGDVRRLLPASAPKAGEPFDALLADLDRVVVPGLTHWQHPRFFAYFPANSSPAAILGDLISSGIGAQGMIWATSPAVTEVEQAVLDWFAEALGLPADFRSDGPGGGVIQDTASTATFSALLAALHRASGGEARRHGLGDAGWRVYGSSQAHSSLVKAAMMAGLGEDAVRSIAVDPETQAIDLAALEAAVEADVEQGLTPVMVHLAAGSTSTGAMDDLVGAGRIARAHGAWVHVDAAWAGVAAVCPEHRAHLAGVESADSFVTNPHKWLLTTFDCSTFWVRDRAALTGALSILPEYLRNAATESGEVVDYRDWHPQLGRRFRAIKLWAVLRTYGLEGLREHVRSGVALAALVADLVRADDRFELVTEPSLSLVVFRLRSGDEQTMAAMEAVNASGEAYLSHTTVEGRAAIRLAVGSWRTTRADVERTWRALQAAADG
ncbi:pyridoxal-dependent decarboxylase [Nocardioides flavus (ex Wang et al. 2016)]|uniref:Pyridoxal-dependent decarboxylase n=1 Tax=Nocardioides flavus (ex Wang et al. 2016) TaxID=2058780 RepID=A0ABQ3HMT4_9ACTN|nr:aminotransferase class V-fold PLP-dependent enzyme [Nocardioides flavus (ex Wang et al. 2016)]GHE18995.1 pyridoxal-dependent decarboxylase [Nocardioides flavus (ex Wang et al. 2016)]